MRRAERCSHCNGRVLPAAPSGLQLVGVIDEQVRPPRREVGRCEAHGVEAARTDDLAEPAPIDAVPDEPHEAVDLEDADGRALHGAAHEALAACGEQIA